MNLEPGNVYCMDALDGLRMLPDGSIDMMLTSPPYDNLRTYNGYSFDFEGIARESYRTLKDGGVLVWVVGDATTIDSGETLTSFRQALYFVDVCGFRMHDTMIWRKDSYPFPDASRYYQIFEYMFVLSKGAPAATTLLKQKSIHTSPNKSASQRNADGTVSKMKYTTGHETRALDNVWDVSTGYMRTTTDKSAYEHPAMFPEELARRHILTWSNPGNVVCDPFSGSGTTWKECTKADRQFIGFEISEEYCNLSRRRIANWKRDSDIEVAPGVMQMGLFA